MAIYFHDAFTVQERDQMISPVINLSGASFAAINFKHAYAQSTSTLSDSLIIYISDDCNETWYRIFGVAEDGSGNFATHVPDAFEFIPQSEDDWCGANANPACFTVDLSPWAGNPDVQLMFESWDFNGNKLYIDDIDVSIFTNMNEPFSDAVQLNMFPNPASKTITFDIRNITEYVDVQILNLQGKVLLDHRYRETNSSVYTSLNIANISSGIYFVKFNNTHFSKTEKLIVE
jgi:hypothetical protein